MSNTQTFTAAVIALVVGLVSFFGLTMFAFAAAPLPTFDADNFSNPSVINNPWLSLPVGQEFEYEGETDEGTETIEIEISGDTKTVMGIKPLVYRDIVWVDGELVEDTRDYLAQDDDGNIWSFGDDVDNYENSKLANHDGAWLAGSGGAKPGYWMPANPKVGDSYRQEYLKGEAEDEAEVISLNAKVKIGLGTYNNCLKTKDTTPLEPDVVEYKYYCKQVGGMVLEEKPEDGERIELVEYEIEDGTDDDEDESEDELAFEEDDDDDEDEQSGVSNVNTASLQMRLIALLQQLIALLSR